MTVQQNPEFSWVQVPFASGNWLNYDTVQYGPCMYAKDSLGFVHLRGLLFCSNATGSPPAAQTIFTLPPGFRPIRTVIWPMFANFGIIDGRMNGDGTFVYNGLIVGTYSSANYISLADMSFWAAL